MNAMSRPPCEVSKDEWVVLIYKVSDACVQESARALLATAGHLTVEAATSGPDHFLMVECESSQTGSLYELIMTIDHRAVLANMSTPTARRSPQRRRFQQSASRFDRGTVVNSPLQHGGPAPRPTPNGQAQNNRDDAAQHEDEAERVLVEVGNVDLDDVQQEDQSNHDKCDSATDTHDDALSRVAL